MEDWQSYCRWCKQNGLGVDANKHKRLLAREVELREQSNREQSNREQSMDRPRKKIEKHVVELFLRRAKPRDFNAAAASNAYRLAQTFFGSHKTNETVWQEFADRLDQLKRSNAKFLSDAVMKDSRGIAVAQKNCASTWEMQPSQDTPGGSNPQAMVPVRWPYPAGDLGSHTAHACSFTMRRFKANLVSLHESTLTISCRDELRASCR